MFLICATFFTLVSLCNASLGTFFNSSCVAQCGAKSNVSKSVCTVDGSDLNVFVGSTVCLFRCGVAAQFSGSCLCPNSCGEHGECTAQGCVCRDGWGGADCKTLVKCSGKKKKKNAENKLDDNVACLNGATCVDDDPSSPSVAYCKCPAGFTGLRCEIAAATDLIQPAFPSLFPNEPVYTPSDPYGDSHPVFNQSAVAQLRVTLDPDDFLYIMDPANAYNASKVKAQVWFRNDAVGVLQFDSVKFSLKGTYSRKFMKKSFKLKFKAKDDFFGIIDLALKCAQDDVTFMHGPLSMDLSRTMGLAVQRTGWTQLFINDVSHGFYVLQEEITDDWMNSRFTSGQGLFKCHSGSYLDYRGTNISDYPSYELKLGPRKTMEKALLGLVSAINQTNFFAPTQQMINLTKVLRYMVVEYFISDTDSYTTFGNNYWLLLDQNAFWTLIPYDQEDAYGGSDAAPFWAQINPFTYFINCTGLSEHHCRAHPLTVKLFNLQRTQFSALLRQFIANLITALPQRIQNYGRLIASQIRNDGLFGIDVGEYNGDSTSYLSEWIPYFLNNYINPKLRLNANE